MADGFLGYEASLMLDVVVVSLVVVVPLLGLSLGLVRFGKSYRLHRRLQVLLGAILLIAVTLFEIDMRLSGGFWQMSKNDSTGMHVLLYCHLFFAISTVGLWAVTLGLAHCRFLRDDPVPGDHSRLHRRLGWLSTLDIIATAVTGLLVYYYGFVASVAGS